MDLMNNSVSSPSQSAPAVGSQTASQTAPHLVSERVLVLDFGSQYAQLIARRIREQNVYCEIVRHNISAETIKARNPTAIVFSGGPSSVYESNAPKCDPNIFKLGATSPEERVASRKMPFGSCR